MKKSKRTNKSKTLRTVILIIVGLMATYTFLPNYLQKGLIYMNPNIDDYKIFDNREVKTGEPIPWPTAEKYGHLKLNQTTIDSLEKYNSVAFLVIQHDSILYEGYWDGYTETTISNSFSMSKSVVSLLIGCAIEEGLIKSLDEKAKKYLPWLNGPYSGDLTIRHLLTMSSASSWDESYSSPFSITTRAYYGRSLSSTIKEVKIVQHPGIVWNYRSGDTQLLERILNKATGLTLSEYASQKLWQPMGAEEPALWSLDRRKGIEKAYCCFNSNARDFARIGNLILNNGSFAGKKILSEDYINKMITPAKYLTNENAEMVDYYGLHWWIMNYKDQEIPYARGILGQYIFVVPQHDAVIVRLGHKRSDSYHNHHPKDAFTWVKAGLEIIKQNN
ncbi:serine hydrolase domain-containing protein [Marinilabilia rubra]|uniref:Serine hydrolase n=1 Tax=Marinilabilia rubra TaxID=2162893 RepID=A0A2U2BEA9_9BACT|nr:serine hydrolase domain-containing protein [Marinilabilia rubra]PWE01399.1 serine hydrolase [Marinilabilia rubra]